MRSWEEYTKQYPHNRDSVYAHQGLILYRFTSSINQPLFGALLTVCESSSAHFLPKVYTEDASTLTNFTRKTSYCKWFYLSVSLSSYLSSYLSIYEYLTLYIQIYVSDNISNIRPSPYSFSECLQVIFSRFFLPFKLQNKNGRYSNAKTTSHELVPRPPPPLKFVYMGLGTMRATWAL